MSSSSLKKSSNFQNFLSGLRGALPYLEEYHNETFVIKISGNTLLQPNLPTILNDLTLLYRIGIKIIIVHGARPQIHKAIQNAKQKVVEKEQRIMVTPSLLPVVQGAIANTNWNLMTNLSRFGQDIFPFSGHFIQAQKYEFKNETENHFTGKVQDINLKALENAFTNHYLPIIPPFAAGEKGSIWILEPNQIAKEIASRLRTRKLIILNSEHIQKNLKYLRETTTENMKKWILQHSDLSIDTKLQAQALIDACERGVERCHWLESAKDGAILGEILTPTGTGLMITNSSYEQVRFARINDIHQINQILAKPVNELAIVHKSVSYIGQHLENYLVYCIDEELVGCCQLIFFEDSKSLEISSLTVKEEYRNRGIAKQLIATAESEAKKHQFTLLFALTTKASHIFKGNGFKEIQIEQLPKEKKENYDFQDSLAFGKLLSYF